MKKIPKFKNEQEEREFWQTHDSTEYVDWGKATVGYFPNLKPTTRLISIRLPEYLLVQIKIEANRLDIPYQSLIKKYLHEKIKQ